MISIVSPNHPVYGFESYNLLSDRGLQKAIASGEIRITPAPTRNQIQPASLDVRIGQVKLYDDEVRVRVAEKMNSLSFFELLDYEPTDEFAKVISNQKDAPIVIPPKAYAEIYFNEQINFDPKDYSVRLDLRSSRGRLGLSLDSMLVKESEEGKYVSLINNNPNPIVLYGQSKFGQLFFYPYDIEKSDGYIVTDPEEAALIASNICVGDFEMYGPYVLLTVGDKVMKFKKNIGPIDTVKKRAKEEMYDTYGTLDGVILSPRESVICQLYPQLKLPSEIGLQILHYVPAVHSGFGGVGPDPNMLLIDNHSVNAGWVDPGYEGFVTAHPIRRKFRDRLYKGKPIALGLIYKYDQGVEVPYGSEVLGSHYQGSKGSVSRS